MDLWRPQKLLTQQSSSDNGICNLLFFSALPELHTCDSGCFHCSHFYCYSQNSLQFSLCHFLFATSGFCLAFSVSEVCHVTTQWLPKWLALLVICFIFISYIYTLLLRVRKRTGLSGSFKSTLQQYLAAHGNKEAAEAATPPSAEKGFWCGIGGFWPED